MSDTTIYRVKPIGFTDQELYDHEWPADVSHNPLERPVLAHLLHTRVFSNPRGEFDDFREATNTGAILWMPQSVEPLQGPIPPFVYGVVQEWDFESLKKLLCPLQPLATEMRKAFPTNITLRFTEASVEDMWSVRLRALTTLAEKAQKLRVHMRDDNCTVCKTILNLEGKK